MITYKKVKNLDGTEFDGGFIRLPDHGYIPAVADNRDYQAYLKWLDGYELVHNTETMRDEWVKTSDGNEPLPADSGE
jgi:hypothetical protein